MILEHTLIGLIVGMVISVVAMYFVNSELRQQQTLQYKFEKSKTKLNEYHEELTNYFIRNTELLINITDNYRQLHQYITKSFSSLLLDQNYKDSPFRYFRTEVKTENDQVQEEIQPLDYPKSISGLTVYYSRFANSDNNLRYTSVDARSC